MEAGISESQETYRVHCVTLEQTRDYPASRIDEIIQGFAASGKQHIMYLYCSKSQLIMGENSSSAGASEELNREIKNAKIPQKQVKHFILVGGKEINEESTIFFISTLQQELIGNGWSKENQSKRLTIVNHESQHTDFFSRFKRMMTAVWNQSRIPQKATTEVEKLDLPDEAPDILRRIWHLLLQYGYVKDVAPSGIKDMLISRYSPQLNLDSTQERIIGSIVGNPSDNHLILGGAGTGKTLLLFNIAAELDRQYANVEKRDDPCNGEIALVFQGNFADEGASAEAQYQPANTKVYNTTSFTQAVAKMLLYPKADDRFSTVLIDEAHGLPSFTKEKFGKTNFGFRLEWWKKYPLKLSNGRTSETSLKDFLSRQSNHKGAEINDFLDLLVYLRQIGKIKNIILCYDSDQWVYSGAIGRDSAFRFSNDSATYHKATFKTHELHHQYRINPAPAEGTTGDDYIAGIRYFLQLDSTDHFNRRIFQLNSEQSSKENQDIPYFGIASSIQELFNFVDEMKDKHPGSHNRVLAGYAVSSKNNQNTNSNKVWFDKDSSGNEIGTGWAWNDKQEGFVFNSELENEHRHQVGSVFAVQGQDLNYVGVIVARDIAFYGNKIHAVRTNYKHKSGSVPFSIPNHDRAYSQKEFDKQLRGIYYILLTRGINGVRVFFQDKNMEKHFKEVMGIQ